MEDMIPKDYHDRVYKLLQDRYIALLERTRWIPVSERLPTPSMQAVLIFDGGEVYYAYFDNNQFIYRHLPGYGPSNVTHWMPLPEPPQEVE